MRGGSQWFMSSPSLSLNERHLFLKQVQPPYISSRRKDEFNSDAILLRVLFALLPGRGVGEGGGGGA